MPANVTECEEINNTETQDVQPFTWVLADIHPPRRSESAPPHLNSIFHSDYHSLDTAGSLQEAVLGASNCGVSELLRSPWSSLSWSSIPKHRSLDSRQLESLAEEVSESNSFFTDLAREAQAASSLSASKPDHGLQNDVMPSSSVADSNVAHLSVSPLSLAPSSPNASPHDSSTSSPVLRHHSPPHHSRLSPNRPGPATPPEPPTSSQSLSQQLNEQPQQQAAPDVASSSGQTPAQHEQRPGQGQGSGRQPGHSRSRTQYPGAAQQWVPHGMGHHRGGSEGALYPPYAQPPPPPPIPQHQRPSMQWHTGQARPRPPRSHDGSGPHPSMGGMLPAQPQQQMGVAAMGLGMYPGVMPYGMMPGMHPQGGMQQPMYLPNGYMMTYYPQMPPSNMPVYGMENGVQGGPQRPHGAFPQSAPFPPALDPHFADYMHHMSQQQVFPGTPLSAHVDRSSKSLKEAAAQGNIAQGSTGQPIRAANGLHRRNSSALSAASSATSADRDRGNRQVPDRRGDGATATNSSAGMRGRGCDDSCAAADPEHMAAAAALLERFKAKTKSQPFELQDIKGYVHDFCRDQHGSRFIQQKLADASPEEIMAVFEEVEPHAISLMQDVFGNYVIQKCFEHGSKEVLEALAGVILGHVLALSLQMYGCRVIQKALEVLPLEQQRLVVRELQGQVMRCVRDQNGNHVIQKSIERVKPTTEIQAIIEDIKGSVVSLSTHPYGCRVVQRVLEHCNISDATEHIRKEILRSTALLATDQYGNYVIQHMLEHGPASARQEIIEKLHGQVVRLSQHKFASNVIEKCLQYGGSNSRQASVQEVLGSSDGESALQMMTKDQYANYVVQKMLEVCDDSQRQLLMTRITIFLNQLKKLTYGKHIVARVEKLLVAGKAAAAVQQAPQTADALASVSKEAAQLQQSRPIIDGSSSTAAAAAPLDQPAPTS
ncbi:hypothetical protein WJX79_007470 [Trebouxia sp. C0005]